MTTETVEDTARAMGWRPKEEYKGDQGKWKDAATFVADGQNFIPFLRKELRTVRDENGQLRGQIQQLTTAQLEAQESVKALTEYNVDIAKREAKIEARRIRAQIVEARKEGNTDKEVELEEELDEHNEKASKLGTTETKSSTRSSTSSEATGGSESQTQDPTKDPEFISWIERNSWFNSDDVMRASSVAILSRLNRDPEFLKLSKREKWDKVSEETLKRFEPAEPVKKGKFESGNGSTRESGRSNGANSGRAYSDLPAEAQKACDSFSSKVVGPNRAYKTIDDWRAKYAKDFDWSDV